MIDGGLHAAGVKLNSRWRRHRPSPDMIDGGLSRLQRENCCGASEKYCQWKIHPLVGCKLQIRYCRLPPAVCLLPSDLCLLTSDFYA